MSEELIQIINQIDRICRVPTPKGTKAYTHFMKDFDAIRKLAAPYLRAANEASVTHTHPSDPPHN